MGVSACGSDGGGQTTAIDAPMPDAWQRTCWPGGGEATQGVDLLLGTGISTFDVLEPEAVVRMYHGLQGGTHFELNARMRGFTPGVIEDPEAPSPHTLFKVFTESGDIASAPECTFPVAYADIGGGWYELQFGRYVQLRDQIYLNLDGQRVRIQVEVFDPQGRYAIVERWAVVEDVTTGLPDGGVADAGVIDAN